MSYAGQFNGFYLIEQLLNAWFSQVLMISFDVSFEVVLSMKGRRTSGCKASDTEIYVRFVDVFSQRISGNNTRN